MGAEVSTEMEGKIALVTGGARNIGKVIAKRLAADGIEVIINHLRSPVEARETQAEIERAGGRAHVVRASVAVREQVDRMFDEIADRFGGLDILVNNAANGALAPSPDVTERLLDRALDTNLKGSLACAQRAAPLMAGRGGGSIVNLSTLGGGQFVMANYLACGPAKAAVEALTRYLAVDLARYGIRVNTAAAGMLTSAVADQFPDAEAMQRAIIAATPMGRLGRPEEFAEVVAFLAGPRSGWITGQLILADGGLATGQALLSPPVTASSRDTAEVSAPANAPMAATQATDPVPAGRPVARSPRRPDVRVEEPTPPVEPIDDEIAVVGMGIVVPGANDPDEYWQELLHGADRFVEIPADRWDNSKFYSDDLQAEDKTYSRHSAFITGFVPPPTLRAELARQGRCPDDVELTTLWLRHSLLQAMEGVTRRDGDRCAFLVGYTADGSQHLEEATVRAGTMVRMEAILAGLDLLESERVARLRRIEAALDRHYRRNGPDPLRFFPHQVGLHAMAGLLPADTDLLLVDTACSSSLYAVDLGLKGLVEGRHDIAVCGGSFAVGPRGSILFAKLNGLSMRGEVRSLDTASDGVLFSDGAATVVLKRLSRARADGDTVLATIRSFGSSSDGKGKAIYAPSAAGQKLAIDRAMSVPGMDNVRPDWIIAHATGTPAGDLAEFTTLREAFGDLPIHVTSNKSIIGHTGWAAGAASLIQVVLALKHGRIPPQHRFTEPPDAFDIDNTGLTIPTEVVDWRADPSRRRTAAVSGFGFGGTNAHLVVQEAPAVTTPIRAASAPAEPARIAVVAHATHLPGGLDDDTFVASFGDTYPLPPIDQVRMPPGVKRGIDRCQLMILQCTHQMRDRLGAFWEEHRLTTGVVVGHLGATRSATLYALRCYIDDLRDALHGEPNLSGEPWLDAAIDTLADEIRALVPPSNEDTFPGMMPNVIPARVANYFGLQGLNMTVDTGFTATLSAIDVAGRYLRQGELTMALVGGINGNTTPEIRDLLGAALGDDAVLAEGAFLFALTTEETARAAGLPILGFLDTPVIVDERNAATVQPGAIECGAPRGARPACYLGAEGAVGILQALRTTNDTSDAWVLCRGGTGAPDLALRVSRPDAPLGGADTEPADREIPAQFYLERHFRNDAGEHPLRVSRHVPGLVPDGGRTMREPVPFWPDAPALVLTDWPDLLVGASLPTGSLVVSTVAGAGARHLTDISPAGVRALLDAHDPDASLAHIRMVSSLRPMDGDDDWEIDTALHDVLFLVVQQRSRELRETPGVSCLAVLLDALVDGTPRPATGLFGGLFKVIHLELPDCLTFALCTSAADLATGAAEAGRESALSRGLPVVCYADGTRLVTSLTEEPGELLSPDGARLGRDSVVVSVGGGRGITAELLIEVARHFGPELFILGSNPVDQHPARYLECSDEEFVQARRDFILRQRAAVPDKTPGQVNREYERIREARVTRANLARLAAYSGAGRVHYLACDVTDAEQVRRTLDDVRQATGGRIDLLINVAGINRSAPIDTKDFGEFRRIRDLKLRGYLNLKRVLRDNPPAAWCNFGSLLGMTGQLGEADYASGNDFLGAAATYSSHVLGGTEFTIGWTLWGEVGLGANELTKAYFTKSGLYSNMSTAEGVHHFVRELNLAKSSPYTIHLGDAEKAAVDRLLPGFLAPQPAGFYLGRVLRHGSNMVEFERVFDLRTDGYLRHHLVAGAPTLPGTFVTEIAYEAARWLMPDLRVYAFEDLVFHHFLKLNEKTGPIAKKISAQVVERRPDLGQARVRVRVSTDVTAPNGTVLVRDKLHFEVDALMADRIPAAPTWQPWHPADETPVPDPYHHPASPVLLTDEFVSTGDTRLHPSGKRATYTLRLPEGHPTFAHFELPTLLLDGLARTGVLALVRGDLVPLAAPLRIGRIDLYEVGGDIEVARRYDHLDLYVIMPNSDPVARGTGMGNRFVAVRPDGRVLLQMKDLDWTVMGYLERSTGRFRTPDEVTSDEPAPASGRPQERRVTPMGKADTGAVREPAPVTSTPVASQNNGNGKVVRPTRRAPGTGQKAPGPRGVAAVPGSLRRFQRNAPQLFLDLHRVYGSMVRLPLGFFTVHLNYDPDAIRYVLQDNNQNYVRGKGYDRFKIFMGIGLLTTDGDEWRERRRIVNPLFHKNAINSMTTTMTAMTTAVLDRWERPAVVESGLDVVPEMMDLTLGALSRVMFDTDLAADSGRVGPAMVTAIEAMVFRGTANQLMPDLLPTAYNRNIRRSRRVMYDIVDRIVAAHHEGRHDGVTDLVQLLLSATDAQTGEGLTRQQVRDEIMTIFMAGHETTGTGLAWALHELAQHPDVQERLHAEVEEVLGGRVPTLADVEKLTYTQMAVDETLRLHPPIWVYPRDSVEEDVVGGWHIPAKSSVFLVPYVTHRMPELWTDPEHFRPERFTPERLRERPKYAYFPFGGGQRKCLGNQMALLQTQLSLAMIVQRFRLRPVRDFAIDMGTYVSFRPTHGIRLAIEPRRR